MCMSGGLFCDFVLCFMSAYVCICLYIYACSGKAVPNTVDSSFKDSFWASSSYGSAHCQVHGRVYN